MKQETQRKLTLKKSSTLFRMIIPSEVEKKIRFVCNKVHEVEWSGPLFYKVDGSIEGNDLVVTCLDFLVMDIGSTGFTSFDDSPDVIAYQCEHPELLENGVYIGLAHSHHNMATWFSGTDTSTLLSEGSDTNHFVSLIVNNAGKYTAGITRKITSRKTITGKLKCVKDSSYNTYQNAIVEIASTEEEKEVNQVTEDSYVEWFELNIDKESVIGEYIDIEERLKEIRENKQKRSTGFSGWGSFGDKPDWGDNYSSFRNYYNKKNSDIPEEKPTYFQQELFKDTESKDTKENKTVGIKDDDLDELDLSNYNATPSIVKMLVRQILTGSIIISAESKFDEVSWAKRMDSIFEKRFGSFDIDSNRKRYDEWVANFIDTLVYEPDATLIAKISKDFGIEISEADTVTVIASDMIAYIDELPDSKCKTIIMENLKNYLY